jgi:hypothetical protein
LHNDIFQPISCPYCRQELIVPSSFSSIFYPVVAKQTAQRALDNHRLMNQQVHSSLLPYVIPVHGDMRRDPADGSWWRFDENIRDFRPVVVGR